MSRRQKVVLTSAAGVLGVLAVVLGLLLALGGDDGEKVAASGTSTSTSSSTSSTTQTTIELVPVTPAPSTTAAPTTSPPTTAAPQPVVDGKGAILAKPSSTEVRTSKGSCDSLGSGEPGWAVTCGAVVAKGGIELTWLLERREPDGATRSYVLRKTGPTSWTVVLAALDPMGNRFEEVNVAVADVSDDGGQEIAFGFRLDGSAQTLAVDLVEGQGAVVVHRDLPKGSARVSTGQMNTWTPDPADPGSVIKQIIRFTSGAWRIISSTKEPGPAPTSQL